MWIAGHVSICAFGAFDDAWQSAPSAGPKNLPIQLPELEKCCYSVETTRQIWRGSRANRARSGVSGAKIAVKFYDYTAEIKAFAP